MWWGCCSGTGWASGRLMVSNCFHFHHLSFWWFIFLSIILFLFLTIYYHHHYYYHHHHYLNCFISIHGFCHFNTSSSLPHSTGSLCTVQEEKTKNGCESTEGKKQVCLSLVSWKCFSAPSCAKLAS